MKTLLLCLAIKGAFFALSTPDAAKCARWYHDQLGFTIAKEGDSPDRKVHFAILQRGDNVIELVQLADAHPALKEASQTHGIFKVGFVVDDLDALLELVKEHKIAIAYGVMDAKDVAMRSFSIRDVDGNLVQFFGH